MASYQVSVEPHYVDTDVGLWCDDCALPSLLRHRFALTVVGGVQVFSRVVVEQCDSCGRSRQVDGG